MTPETSAKRLQLLKELLPRARRVAVLWNPRNAATARNWKETQEAGGSLGLKLLSVEMRTRDEVATAFAAIARERPDALFVLTDTGSGEENRGRISSRISLHDRLLSSSGPGGQSQRQQRPMIAQYEPMQPTLVREPFHRPGWVYEEKLDGYRMLAYKDGKHVRLVSRKSVDHTRHFPELAAAVASLPPRTLLLDGEVAIFDAQLRSRFDWLREPDPEGVATPPLLMVFDLLYRAGRDLSARPLRERRTRLEELVAGGARIFPVRRLAPNGLEAWAQVLERGYEGYVAKDDASPYVGGKTRAWLKVKVPGWTDPDDRWRRALLPDASR